MKVVDLGNGWLETPCVGCEEPLLLTEGDEVVYLADKEGKLLGIFCYVCNKLNEEWQEANGKGERQSESSGDWASGLFW